MTLEDARRVLSAAEAKARDIGQPMNVAVVGRIMIFAGGLPLKADGRVVGAVGVSGGTGIQDQQVAEAGAAGF
jgi:uncharacterized protein GlcG (DUF336 family)